MMMVIEGLPAWIFCLVWFYAIPKSLSAAKWLAESDRLPIEKVLAAEQAGHKDSNSSSCIAVFKEPSVWLLMIGFACSQIILYGLTLWLPTIFKSFSGLSEMMVGVLSGAPFIMSMVGVYYITNRSDKHNQERRWHAAIPMVISGLTLIVLAEIPAHALYAKSP